MVLSYSQIKIGTIPTRHCKVILQKPFPVRYRWRKTYRVRNSYKPLEILLLDMKALDTIYLVLQFSDDLPSSFWDMTPNVFWWPCQG